MVSLCRCFGVISSANEARKRKHEENEAKGQINVKICTDPSTSLLLGVDGSVDAICAGVSTG